MTRLQLKPVFLAGVENRPELLPHLKEGHLFDTPVRIHGSDPQTVLDALETLTLCADAGQRVALYDQAKAYGEMGMHIVFG